MKPLVLTLLVLFCYRNAVLAQSPVVFDRVAALERRIVDNEVFAKGTVGFCLYDPTERRYLYEYQADRFFTPASNTKIFTFYLALEMLDQGAPLVQYRLDNDTLHLRGTGWPLLLHPDFADVDPLADWLAQQSGAFVLHEDHQRTRRFGPGWSWDDYTYTAERSALPLYANAFHFSNAGNQLAATPRSALQQTVYRPTQRETLLREEDQNRFYFNREALRRKGWERSAPFRTAPPVVAGLLSDTLQRPVVLGASYPDEAYQSLLYPVPDTLYRRLMQRSDNFIAEQLLLLCSARRYGYLDADQVLDFARDTLFTWLPPGFSWYDGSGLSRYNQFSPRSVVQVLWRLYLRPDRERILSIFPAGGQSGTIAQRYGDRSSRPYVFAKTGTLRNVHALSGYVRTRSGRWLIFSFMLNNLPDPGGTVRTEMERVLDGVYEWF
jgi:D-alanyl-D-alanine carboxypeptidase/D-alanyl-D-alanine-endopeptidase (penicillin-binding protein 4)